VEMVVTVSTWKRREVVVDAEMKAEWVLPLDFGWPRSCCASKKWDPECTQ
jgi:hypothetical protein